MNVKIDTKEKFTVLTPQAAILSANMTEDMEKLADYSTNLVPHLVINMNEVKEISVKPARVLADIQQRFYERDHSFVICCLQPEVEAVFEQEELIDVMNITLTESEAWDIVQMEEIERELMRDFEEDGQ
ncbi:MAG: STAS domain-containing protein [Ferruginibacter sp.]|nr:STAS domain-containing protein [Ferruginibacter sp.]